MQFMIHMGCFSPCSIALQSSKGKSIDLGMDDNQVRSSLILDIVHMWHVLNIPNTV